MARVSTAPMGVRQRPEPRHCLALTRGLCKAIHTRSACGFLLAPAAPFRLVTNGPAAESSCCGDVSANVAILIVNRLACRARRVRRARLRATWRGYQRSLHTRPYTTLVLVAGLGFLVGRAGVVERACDDRGLAAPHQACGQSAGHEPYTLWGSSPPSPLALR